MKQFLGALLLLAIAPTRAFAWGCDGHQAVAMLAEGLLRPTTIAAIRTVLAASPIDPAIRPYCPPVIDDPIADAATWADDNRSIDQSTARWHYINFPLVLGANLGDYRRFCPNGNCAVDAIVAQYQVLTTTTDPKLRGNALRYLIHFVGDLHQPLHTTTNGDRGGNCLPMTYGERRPEEDQFHDYRPNLHSVWDEALIRRVMETQGLRDAHQLAAFVARSGSLRAAKSQVPTASIVSEWAKEINANARKVTYGRLPTPVPQEPVSTFALASCDENNHVSRRMAALGEKVDAGYETASVALILSQMRLAAERLAGVLQAAFAIAPNR